MARARHTRALHVDISAKGQIFEDRVSDCPAVGEYLHPDRMAGVDLVSGDTLVDNPWVVDCG